MYIKEMTFISLFLLTASDLKSMNEKVENADYYQLISESYFDSEETGPYLYEENEITEDDVDMQIAREVRHVLGNLDKGSLDKALPGTEGLLPLYAYVEFIHRKNGYQTFNLELLTKLVQLKKGAVLSMQEGAAVIHQFVADCDKESTKIMLEKGLVDPNICFELTKYGVDIAQLKIDLEGHTTMLTLIKEFLLHESPGTKFVELFQLLEKSGADFQMKVPQPLFNMHPDLINRAKSGDQVAHTLMNMKNCSIEDIITISGFYNQLLLNKNKEWRDSRRDLELARKIVAQKQFENINKEF